MNIILTILIVSASSNCKTEPKANFNVSDDIATTYYTCLDSNNNEILHGFWEERYNNGVVRSKGKYELDKKQGPWFWQYQSGQKSKGGLYIDNIEHGYWIWYWENGAIWQAGPMCMGKNCGIWDGFYKDGTWRFKTNWADGQLCGKMENFYDNGQLAAKGYMIKDTKVGEWTYWDNTGKVTKRVNIPNNFKFKCSQIN